MSVPQSGWTSRNGILWNNYLAPYAIAFRVIDTGPVVAPAPLQQAFLTRSLPGGASVYTLIATLQGAHMPLDSSQFGVCLTDATKYIFFGSLSQTAANGGINRLRVARYATVHDNPGTNMAGPTIDIAGIPLTVKIVVDATHRTFFYWAAGAWVQFYQEAAGAYLTETDAGFGGVSVAGALTGGMYGWLAEWSLTTP